MENKRKYLWILTLVSLVWGTAAFNSYADNKNKGNKGKVVKKVVTTEVIVSKNEDKVKKEKRKKEKKGEVKEVKPARPLKKVKSEEGKFTGEASFEGAHNVGVTYPAKTDFFPSLIITKKSDQKKINAFDLGVTVKLCANKKFIFEDEIFNGTLEVKATKTAVKLSQIFLTWKDWTFGITKNNFGTIATFPAAKVAQLSWNKDINAMFTIGLGIEEAKEFSFFEANVDGKKKAKDPKALKPRKDLPATSARVQYNLPDKWGSIELSGLFRPLGWFNPTEKKTKFHPGFGVNLGGKINVRPETDILTVNFVFGQAIGEYIADVAELDNQPISIYYDYVDANGVNVKVKDIMTGGAYATYEHHWTPSLRSTFGTGMTAILNDHKKEKPDFYKLGVYGSANLVYWFTEHTSVGVEYGVGRRNNADDSNQDSKGASHIKAMLEFKI